jgi:Pyruvate/2-oxoacid:ferredoxin oxidoreductase delta subunit
MTSAQAMHRKFNSYWKEYERKDLLNICWAICKDGNIKIKGNNAIEAVKNNWSKVCNFLIQWEGRN